MCTLHLHFFLTHLNLPIHSHTDIVSNVNLAYCNEILAFFFVSFFYLISLYKLHFHNISGLLNAHLSQVGSWKYTRLSNLPSATQEGNGRARDKLKVSQSSSLVAYKNIPSLPQKHRQYMRKERNINKFDLFLSFQTYHIPEALKKGMRKRILYAWLSLKCFK